MTNGISAAGLETGALKWNETELAVRPADAAKSVAAEFRFQNTGSSAVRVVSVKSSCDCLSARGDKESYAPGESGFIRAEFAVGGREGRQEKTIAVTTDAAPHNPTLLTLFVDIPEPVVVRQQFVFWRVDEDTTEKVIDIVLSMPKDASIGDVQCTESTFTARLTPGETDGQYRVKITPASTAKIAQATIRLNATIDGQPRIFVLYAAVK